MKKSGDVIYKSYKGNKVMAPKKSHLSYRDGRKGQEHPEYQYLDILAELRNAKSKQGPQEHGSSALFVREMRFDLSKGDFPLLTTKKMFWKSAAIELLWMLRGDSKLDFMHKHDVHMWDKWATKEVAEPLGLEEWDTGPIYGPNWIHWKTEDGREINQIRWVIDGLKEHPEWRRWRITAWNPGNLEKGFLVPCHGDVYFFVQDGVLSMSMVQRSGDFFIGVPYNIAFYSLMLLMVAQVTGLKLGEFVHVVIDAHLYNHHRDGTDEQLLREPLPFPQVRLNPKINDIFDFTYDDIELINYKPHPRIAADADL